MSWKLFSVLSSQRWPTLQRMSASHWAEAFDSGRITRLIPFCFEYEALLTHIQTHFKVQFQKFETFPGDFTTLTNLFSRVFFFCHPSLKGLQNNLNKYTNTCEYNSTEISDDLEQLSADTSRGQYGDVEKQRTAGSAHMCSLIHVIPIFTPHALKIREEVNSVKSVSSPDQLVQKLWFVWRWWGSSCRRHRLKPDFFWL